MTSKNVVMTPQVENEQLRNDLKAAQNALEKVKSDLSRSRESYVRRERAYKTRIDELEDSLQMLKSQKTDLLSHDDKMTHMRNEIKGNYEAIVTNVGVVQDRTTKILQEQERDLLRAFRARLFDVQTELEKEKSRTDDGATKYIEEAKQTKRDLEWFKENCDRLDTRNQTLSKDNERLKGQFQTQEKDRNYLIGKLVEEKRRGARLGQDAERLERENQKLLKQLQASKKGQGMGMTLDNFNFAASPGGSNFAGSGMGQRPGTTGGMGRGSLGDTGADSRYKEIIKRLKRLLETERRNLSKARDRYFQEVKQRTEMEVLLKDCVDDVRSSIKAKNDQKNPPKKAGGRTSILGTGKQTGGVTIDDFTSTDRERVLELLFAKERVITLLQAKAFPPKVSENGGAAGATKEEMDEIFAGIDKGARPSTSNEAVGVGGGMGSSTASGGGLRPITAT